MSLSDDLRQLADLIDSEPAVGSSISRGIAGGHFVWHADRYGDVFNAVRKVAPVKVRVLSDAQREGRPMVFDAHVGELHLSVLKARS